MKRLWQQFKLARAVRRGTFAIDKPHGMSSQRAVQIVKRIAQKRYGKRVRVGHGGTLDPLATGVLVVAVGREHTKQLNEAVGAEKEYSATLFLGATSTTDDEEGDKTIAQTLHQPTEEEVRNVLEQFVGEITQQPSVYSAIKIDGQEAYKRTRRGETVEMPERTVQIKSIALEQYAYPLVDITVQCGTGTYIRTLARDVGEALGTTAYLRHLRRMRVGEYIIAEAVRINALGK